MTDRLHKFAKHEVAYTDKAMKPSERCGLCEHYRYGGSCQIVKGRIDARGWCKKFEKRS